MKDQKTNTTSENTTLTAFTNNIFDIVEIGVECAKVRYSTTNSTATLFNAVNGSGKKLKDFIDSEITVNNIVITTAEVHKDKNDENSPLEKRPVVHFFTEFGEHISSLSTGICRSVKGLMEIGIMPTPDNPLTFKVVTVETKNGTAHSLELME